VLTRRKPPDKQMWQTEHLTLTMRRSCN
jgi:hypothetical protein